MGLFGGSALILVGFVYWATIGQLERQIDARILSEVQALAERYPLEGIPGLGRTIQRRLEQRTEEPMLYLLAPPDGLPIAGNLPGWPEGRFDGQGWFDFSFTDARGREIPARGQIFALGDGMQILVARALGDLQASRDLVNKAYVWSMVLGLGLAGLGGTLISVSVTRRIDAINRTSREIMTGSLKERVPLRGVHDEFDQLAENLNAMLDRIDSLIEGVRAVADNIAHDLRTPLTRLRSRLEGMVERADLDEGVRLELAAALQDADHLLTTFRALLRIARIESGSHDRVWSDVDLTALVADAWELYHAVGEEKEVRVRLQSAPARVTGDRDLIFQAISNLLDNAVKYSPAGGEVMVSLESAADHVDVVVTDRGPGIPAGERDRVLDRFYRASTAIGIPGSGLGLSLVQAIARHHGGQVLLGDNGPGLRACLRLPVRPPVAVAGGR